MKNLKNLGKALNKAEQKEIFGGMPMLQVDNSLCNGMGSGGVFSEGFSDACVGYSGRCTINGYLASCGGDGGFWFY